MVAPTNPPEKGFPKKLKPPRGLKRQKGALKNGVNKKNITPGGMPRREHQNI